MIASRQKMLAIVCGGGPAPGINSVISSVTIEARKNGWEVLGIYDGFAHLCKGIKNVVPLTIDMVSRIHYDGGSMLRMSRANPTKAEESLRKAVETLLDLGVTHLVTIGGDDTAYSAFKISEYATQQLGMSLQVVHVPKTIDNDLPLPEGVPTFGFETARALGAQLVSNLMEDARTTGRWYFAIAMGRTAGHLALGIGKSASATLTIIPEAFGTGQIRLQNLVDLLTASIIKRLALKRDYGVAVVAEGIVEKIAPEDLKNLEAHCFDEHGHIRYAELNFPELLKQAVMKNLCDLGVKMTIVGKEIGYELRCAPPNAYDIEYTRNLGYAAFDFLRNGGSDALITIQNNRITPISFAEILDMQTKKTKVRMVNIHSIQYQIAKEYMVFLEKDDLDDSMKLKALAAVTKLSEGDLVKRFAAVAL
ncbi:diphosphate--fructose-6-phosphate 1-phosphotransferase [Azotosporobacter soli]|uniref:diphosphate--fructose-6-phosphate 1-phosphotransferase n=1 Tax=Azotosporobacter soli TaxID=3055040 RepID=UPI003D1617D4